MILRKVKINGVEWVEALTDEDLFAYCSGSALPKVFVREDEYKNLLINLKNEGISKVYEYTATQ